MIPPNARDTAIYADFGITRMTPENDYATLGGGPPKDPHKVLVPWKAAHPHPSASQTVRMECEMRPDDQSCSNSRKMNDAGESPSQALATGLYYKIPTPEALRGQNGSRYTTPPGRQRSSSPRTLHFIPMGQVNPIYSLSDGNEASQYYDRLDRLNGQTFFPATGNDKEGIYDIYDSSRSVSPRSTMLACTSERSLESLTGEVRNVYHSVLPPVGWKSDTHLNENAALPPSLNELKEGELNVNRNNASVYGVASTPPLPLTPNDLKEKSAVLVSEA